MRLMHLSDSETQSLLDGVLTPSKVIEMESHLAFCTRCSRTLDEYRTISAELSRCEVEPAASDFIARVMARLPSEPDDIRSRRLIGSVVRVSAVLIALLLVLIPFEITLPVPLLGTLVDAALPMLTQLNLVFQSVVAAFSGVNILPGLALAFGLLFYLTLDHLVFHRVYERIAA